MIERLRQWWFAPPKLDPQTAHATYTFWMAELEKWPHPEEFKENMPVSMPGLRAYMYLRELALER